MLSFDTPDIHALLDAATPEAIQAATFGIVRLDENHQVVSYNAWEARLSGLDPTKVIGRHFFREVAPCTNNFLVAQRLLDESTLDATIDYVFTFRMRPTAVKLRLLQSPDLPSRYVLVARR